MYRFWTLEKVPHFWKKKQNRQQAFSVHVFDSSGNKDTSGLSWITCYNMDFWFLAFSDDSACWILVHTNNMAQAFIWSIPPLCEDEEYMVPGAQKTVHLVTETQQFTEKLCNLKSQTE